MASRSLGTLTLDLIAKIGGFRTGMDQAARIADTRTRSINRSMQTLQRSITTVLGAIGGALLVRKVVAATIEQERALAQLEARLKSTGNAAGFTVSELSKIAGELQGATTFGDEEILDLQARLAAFTRITGENFTAATKAALDLATAMGTDLKSAAQVVGQSLNNPLLGITRLRRSGIEFTKTQQDLIKGFVATGQTAEAQSVILGELNKIYGGSAPAAADTFAGAIEQLKKAFGDLFEGNGGIGDNKAAIQELVAFLRSPETVAAAATFANAIIKLFGAAAKSIVFLVRQGEALGKFFIRFRDLTANDDIDALNARVKKRSASIEKLKSPFALDFTGSVSAALEKERAQLLLLIKDYDAAKAARESAGGTTTGTAVITTATVAPPSQEFLKLEEQLEKQIALFGKAGEAARLAYEIASGSLADLSEKEAARILSLARQIDAQAASAEAAKATAAEQQRITDDFAKREEAYDSLINKTNELTEVEKLRVEINNGVLLGITSQQQSILESLAQQVDAVNAVREAEDARAVVLERGRSIIEATRTPLEKYVEQLKEIYDLYNRGAFGEDPDAAAETLIRASQQAANELEASAEKINKFGEEATRQIQGLIANFLQDPFRDGLQGLARDFARLLLQMQAQALAAKIGEKLFGADGLGSGGGGFLSGLFSSIFGGTRDSGGRGQPGRAYAIGTGAQPEMFIPDSPGTFVPRDMMSSPNITVRPQIVNVRDPSEIPQALQSNEGEQAILNVIARNPSFVRGLLQGG